MHYKSIDRRHSTTRSLTKVKPEKFSQLSHGESLTLFSLGDFRSEVREGGLRLAGYYKSNSAGQSVVTVITVVYNAIDTIKETIESVINQKYKNVEYIIVDGGSTDGTLDVIKKYESLIDYWVSEPDSGIYDGMNKGIDLASGDWINFMNAGDVFYDDNVLDEIFVKHGCYEGVSIIFGDHEVRYPNKHKIVRAGKVEELWKGSQFCHQSAFIEGEYQKAKKFNLCNRIVADFEFFYKAYINGRRLEYIPCVISTVSSGGVSDVKRVESTVERWLVIERNNLVDSYYIFNLIKIKLVDFLKGLL